MGIGEDPDRAAADRLHPDDEYATGRVGGREHQPDAGALALHRFTAVAEYWIPERVPELQVAPPEAAVVLDDRLAADQEGQWRVEGRRARAVEPGRRGVDGGWRLQWRRTSLHLSQDSAATPVLDAQVERMLPDHGTCLRCTDGDALVGGSSQRATARDWRSRT